MQLSELEAVKEALKEALDIVNSISQTLNIPTQAEEHKQDEVLTITELRERLKLGKNHVYDIIEQPGCPVYNLGGERQNRVIWGEFIEWFRNQYRVN